MTENVKKTTQEKPRTTVENQHDVKSCKITGTCVRDGRFGACGCVFSKEAMRDAVEEFKKEIDNNRAYGCISDYDTMNLEGETPLAKVSHRITDISFNELTKSIDVTAEVVDTPNGRIVKDLVDHGFSLEFGARGFWTGGDEFTLKGIDLIYGK